MNLIEDPKIRNLVDTQNIVTSKKVFRGETPLSLDDETIENLIALERIGTDPQTLDDRLSDGIAKIEAQEIVSHGTKIRTKRKHISTDIYRSPDQRQAKKKERSDVDKASFRYDTTSHALHNQRIAGKPPPEPTHTRVGGKSITQKQITACKPNGETNHQNNLLQLHLMRYHGHIYVHGEKQEHRHSKK